VTSVNPENGFPVRKIHQMETAGIFHLEKVEHLKMDSLQGEYTRRNRAGIFHLKKSKPRKLIPHR